jgi:hydroxymethylbilane synthase
MRRLRLGTRGSRLALVQSGLVMERLAGIGVEVELVTVVTEGDGRLAAAEIGEGIFVTALERQLASGRIDLAVHSAKDIPLRETGGLVVAAYPERADPRDALVTRGGGSSPQTLPARARVGTDSPRRRGFLLALRPDLDVRPLRGNVDSRLRLLAGGDVEALVLAAAGLQRLGEGGRIDHRFSCEEVPPAAAQGALAVQCREDDSELLSVLSRLDDGEVRVAVRVERLVLEATGGNCNSPVGALATVANGRMTLVAGAAAPDGSQTHLVRLETEATADVVRRAAVAAGQELLEKVVSPVG